MRYRIRVYRAQKADRVVNAVDEDDAIRKVRQELQRPYGYLGRWEDVNTDVEIVAAEPTLPNAPPILGEGGSLLMSIKDAAAHLGVNQSAMRELVSRGKIDHVRLGKRIYIARDAMHQFIDANGHRGYWRP